MNHPALKRHAADRGAAVDRDRIACSEILPLLREPKRSRNAKQTIVQLLQHGFVGIADPRCGLDKSLKHGFEIGARLADHLEDFAGRSLVFQRLLQILRTPAQFTEQPRILHCNHRLRGEILQ